ncbi:MAG: leucine--tRNA ligase [Bacteroidetes bacterium]|nr:leucine--tRNA ligase [Bacteroidota bacterium]
MGYDFQRIEKKWQDYWSKNQTYKAEINHEKPKYYVLDMFPYPSGSGLHVGHPLGYIASDIYSRFKRHKGYNVLHPMGYDAYGLPAEQYAIQTGTHPEITTEKNILRYREQLDKIGFSFDWSREVRTSDPNYYKWTQWTFIQLFNSWFNNISKKAEKIDDLIKQFEIKGNSDIDAACAEVKIFSSEDWNGYSEQEQQEMLLNYRLAYLSNTMVNWCPDLGTVLANDEVKEGLSERGGHPVEKKMMKQWSLRITAFGQRLLEGLDKLDWPDSLKEMQRNWIGRSDGASVVFKIKTSPQPSPMERGQDPRCFNTDAKTWAALKNNVKDLRKNPTKAESLLWEKLRKNQTGYHIRRQHAIDSFIVDFACVKCKTVIEIDGEIHNYQQAEDNYRTSILEQNGFTVIRFNNSEVFEDIDNVVLRIKKYLDKKEESLKVLPSGEDSGGVEVFTTRPDTLFGASFMVLAPEHELTDQITTPDNKETVDSYKSWAKNRSERERMTEVKHVTGEFTGAYAINPLTNEEIPIWIADYVLSGYGTGAIMAVPGHDSRDFAFARHFDLPIIQVVVKKGDEPSDPSTWEDSYDSKEGVMINSGFITGMSVAEAIKATISKIEDMGIGNGTVNYRLRDAIFSRQRYWGEPFPIYYKDGMPYALNERELPLELPKVDSYLPTSDGSPPLANAHNWVTKEGYPLETNTMPGFAGSSGYYLRYMDPNNRNEYFSKEANEYWKDVDLYIGGDEHAAGHLIYSRFWNKFLFDLGLVCEDEPFKKLINQGKIQGRSSFVYRIQGTNKFVSYNLRNEYQTQALHVDIDIVSNDVLDTEAFKNWRAEFNTAEFILEDDKYICGHEVEKMSKSKHNVQNPDALIEKYGADTLRLYEMFLGPLEQDKPWDTNGIEGVFRFLRKLWRLYFDDNDELIVSEEKASDDALKSLHKTIKKVTSDIERFSFNTGVSAFMICVNELNELKCHNREILEPLAILLSPYAPHISEEIWQILGNNESISTAIYPIHNESYLAENTFEYPVSFNGKMRFKIALPVNMPKSQIEEEAISAEEAQKWLEGKSVRKIIVVPNRIINIVVG